MSSDENPREGAQVIDEQNRIDNRLKDRILDARDRVAQNEDEVFIKTALDDDITRSQAELVQIWGTSVRQYLKTIEPLLRSDELTRAGYFYRDLPIIDKTVIPRDGATVIVEGNEKYKREINWSRFFTSDIDNREIIRDTPLLAPGFKPPEARQVELSGLKDVIETTRISESWRVPLNPDAAFGEATRVAHPTYREPLSKSKLEYAVRKADQFLQEAGVGLEVGDPTSEADADYSDIEEIDSLDSDT
jgi:hypothetical protein